jgi:ribonuclease HI
VQCTKNITGPLKISFDYVVESEHGGCILGLHNFGACGGIFRYNLANHRGSFTMNLGSINVLHSELMAMILAMEVVGCYNWNYLCIESDSKVALSAFDNAIVVPWNLCNCWNNCFSLELHIISTHIYREDNSCADKLANHGYSIANFAWWSPGISF